MGEYPIRILQVVGSLNRGGIETWLRDAVARLPQERYQCDFCTYRSESGAYGAELQDRGCCLHYIRLGSSPMAFVRFAKRFRRLLRQGRYDVVHCHGLLLVGVILLLAWVGNTPVRIAHAHGTGGGTGRVVSVVNQLGLALNRVMARAFSTYGIGCSTEAGAALFGRRWLQNSKHKLIHCGIDLQLFEVVKSLNSERAGLGIGPEAKVIGHVGNFSVAKNHRFLVEVAARVFQKRADTVLLLVGGGNLRPTIERRCVELGIERRVIFAGVSSRVPDLMSSAMDVFMLPSLHEGLPLVLLEAQAAGLPCIVSDIVSREVMISDGSILFLPLSADIEAWSSTVLSVLESSTVRPSLLSAMRHSDFNIVASAKRLGDLYDDAHAGRAACTGV